MERALSFIIFAALLAGPFVAHLLFPLPCPMKVATGLDCPGCGGTRAIGALLTGDLSAALGFNAIVIVAPALMAFYLIALRMWPSWRGLRKYRFWLAMGVLAVWTVLRNLPGLEVLRAAS